jgi:hypothetical protein
MKALFLAAAGALALGLSACATTAALSPAAQNDIASALAVACPIAAATRTVALNDANARAAYALLAGVCPPNPPPSTSVVAAVDILNAYSAVRAALK